MRVGLDLPPQQRVFGGFFVYAFCIGSLPPRLPDLQRMMQIEEGPLGFGLIGAAAGTLVSLSFFGPNLRQRSLTPTFDEADRRSSSYRAGN
jgi:hypothetical protein